MSSPDKGEASAFRRAFTENQFQRELRLQLLVKAARHEATGAVAVPAEKTRKAWGLSSLSHGRKKASRSSTSKVASTPKALFDTDATLRILVDVARDVAAGRAEQLAAQQQHSAGLDLTEKPSAAAAIEALAALDESRSALAAHLQRESATVVGRSVSGDPNGGDMDRVPESAADLDAELLWLQRKVEASRHEARHEEAALRERFRQRGKAPNARDIARDDKVLAAVRHPLELLAHRPPPPTAAWGRFREPASSSTQRLLSPRGTHGWRHGW